MQQGRLVYLYVAVKFLVHVSIGIKISVDVFHTLTRKHSSRMHTVSLPTVGASVANRCQFQWTRGVLKRTSLSRSPVGRVPCLISRGWDMGEGDPV